MTFQPLTPWPPIEDVLALPRNERFELVRTNLANPNPRSRLPHMSHEEFGKALGLSGRTRPIAWEREENPDVPHGATIQQLAQLTGYPPATFGGHEEAELVRVTFVDRLRWLEEQAAGSRVLFLALLEALAAAGVRVPLSPEAAEFLATLEPADQGGS